MQRITVRCENGHEVPFWVVGHDYGEFASHESVSRVPLASYAYTHGGCCYRAAVRALHELSSTVSSQQPTDSRSKS